MKNIVLRWKLVIENSNLHIVNDTYIPQACQSISGIMTCQIKIKDL